MGAAATSEPRAARELYRLTFKLRVKKAAPEDLLSSSFFRLLFEKASSLYSTRFSEYFPTHTCTGSVKFTQYSWFILEKNDIGG